MTTPLIDAQLFFAILCFAVTLWLLIQSIYKCKHLERVNRQLIHDNTTLRYKLQRVSNKPK